MGPNPSFVSLLHFVSNNRGFPVLDELPVNPFLGDGVRYGIFDLYLRELIPLTN